ncbi:bile acid:sodium symporter family protein [Nocardia sp. NPDC020380]|uniref:bile acid:sodium symporter family protein n=1 Tax=Nocardia sp. NPDC020380 TaxID=3364309 RepID=UPI0037A49BCB
MRRARIDPYVAALLATVMVASITPVRGEPAVDLHRLTTVAIGLLFFLYGVRLSAGAAVRGLRHWRLHAVVFAATFVAFPLLGVACRALTTPVLGPQLSVGVLFLCCLPSTVQSSIAFTSLARGNVAAAICSASVSNLLGIALTPILVALLLATGSGGGVSVDAVAAIVIQLLAPFMAGQLSRRWIGEFVARHSVVLGYLDRASILLVVYAAFSTSVTAGIWGRISMSTLAWLLVVDAVILGILLAGTTIAARRLRFDTADEIAIVFCGSKKSLASGLPMAGVLFPAAAAGSVVLPLMLFHQMQLMVCAWLARRYGNRSEPVAGGDPIE